MKYKCNESEVFGNLCMKGEDTKSGVIHFQDYDFIYLYRKRCNNSCESCGKKKEIR